MGERVTMLHMNGGTDESSYANNSSFQQKVILVTKPIRTKAVNDLISNNFSNTFCIADLGCSSGPNALLVTSELVETIVRARAQLGLQSPEVQVFLNDLPGNDFNTVFKLLHENEKGKGCLHQCYYTGVPGSFYDRLFPTESLHFIHSSYSLHWLSQVPAGLEQNRKNISLASTSPTSVKEAYYRQFHTDFSSFLKHRAIELVPGGRMVLTMQGRTSEEVGKDRCLIMVGLLAEAISDMVSEGLIQEQELHSFNLPYYNPPPNEISSVIEEEGSFIVDQLDSFHADRTGTINGSSSYEALLDNNDGFVLMKAMRSVLEPMLLHHFHEGILDDMFNRYQHKIAERIARGIPGVSNIIVSLKKKTKMED